MSETPSSFGDVRTTSPCPRCEGRGKTATFIDGRDANGRSFGKSGWFQCSTCAGTGRLDGEQAQAIADAEARGAALKADRKARGASLKEEADRLGIRVIDLHHMERGRDPKTAEAESNARRHALLGNGGAR